MAVGAVWEISGDVSPDGGDFLQTLYPRFPIFLVFHLIICYNFRGKMTGG